MPLLDPGSLPDGIANAKTGNAWTASMHIFCAIVGAGVLALPNTFVALGWIAGPCLIVAFYAISMLTSFLLADVYQIDGVEFARYHHAVRYILSRWESYALAVCQMGNMVLVTIAYTVSPATAMKRIAQLACEFEGRDLDDCWDSTWKMTLIFGALQVPLSLMPNLESLWWISGIGALMSVIYATIALALGLKYASNHMGTIGGLTDSPADKTFSIMNALGAIAFAYAFHVILLEIQDTLRQPPRASRTMKKATFWSINLVFFYYIVIAVGGYASLGNDAPSYIFAGYPQAPRWVMMFGNICLLVHMVSAFQLYAQPVFETIESNVKAYVFRGKYAKHARTAGVEGGEPQAREPADVAKDSLTQADEGGALASQVDSTSPVPTDPVIIRVPATGPLPLDTPVPGAPRSGIPIDFHARPSPGLKRKSSTKRQLERLSRASAMYRVSTGLANDDVETNEEHRLPFLLRFGMRTLYVIAVTVIACCLPFFSDIAGLIGAVTFWPLSVYFPIAMWRKVYRPKGLFNVLLVSISLIMFLVAVVATVGSIRSIVESSKNYTVFGD